MRIARLVVGMATSQNCSGVRIDYKNKKDNENNKLAGRNQHPTAH